MTVKIIVANDKGGVGKTTLAQFCAVEIKRRTGDVRVVEYDGRHRLKRFFAADEVVSVLPPNDGTSGAWDPLIDILDDARPTVLDLGAGMWEAFLAWAESTMLTDFVDSSRLIVLTPLTADMEAVAGARAVVEGSLRVLPGARPIMLACDKDGDVETLASSPCLIALKRSLETVDGEFRSFPVMAREGYPPLAARGVRFDHIISAAPRELAAAAGMPLPLTARTIAAVRNWMDAARGVLDDVLTPVPEPVSAAATAAETCPPPRVPEASTDGGFVFDDAAYLSLYPDVARAVADGLFASGREHYLSLGMREGRLAPRS